MFMKRAWTVLAIAGWSLTAGIVMFCTGAAVAEDAIFSVGYNDWGQLGIGEDTWSPGPVLIDHVICLSTNSCHTLAIKEDGTVWGWGSNSHGELGQETLGVLYTVPIKTEGLNGMTTVAAGYDHSLSLRGDGTVWGWGANNYGQLGDGTTQARATPGQVIGLTLVVAIAAGSYHSVAVCDDGTVWTWGRNSAGQLGDGSTINRLIPIQVSNLSGVVDVAAGDRHNVALRNDGTVWTWGYNVYGQLGDGTTTDRNFPAPVPDLVDVEAVAAGGYHCLALLSDHTVSAWGFGGYGQLGDGILHTSYSPGAVPGLTNIQSVSAGDYQSFALRNDGTAWGWGANTYGQLGNGVPQTICTTPVQVLNLIGAKSICGGSDHGLALANDNTVWAWGRNICGVLGDGTNGEIRTLRNIQNLTNAAAVAIGGYHV